MKKYLIYSFMMLFLISCKKETTTPSSPTPTPAVKYTKFGVENVGGKYYPKTQIKIQYPNNPETIFDNNYTADISYLGNGKIKFDLNPSVSLPDSLKHINYTLHHKSESITAENIGLCIYYFYSDKKYKPSPYTDSTSCSTLVLTLTNWTSTDRSVNGSFDFTYHTSIMDLFSAQRK
jgi:hypothetical protein